MKYALLITQNCNLACRYCYITKNRTTIDIPTAKQAVNYIFQHSMPEDHLDIGFFGGEPLLEFDLLKEITFMIESHPQFSERKIELQVTSNGTIFSDSIAGFLNLHKIGLGISCDGGPSVQDVCRKFSDGRLSSKIIEKNLMKAIDQIPGLMVNAVYTPDTYKFLPKSLDYFYNLGLRKIFINPDFSSMWAIQDVAGIQEIYNVIAKKYCQWHETGDPAFISLIDGKITVILKDGYSVNDRCHMGKKEFAITPNGNIFPCERLVVDGSPNDHCIGNIYDGIDEKKFCKSRHFSKPLQSSCDDCKLKRYCMNWCGCSNYFSTGKYNQAGPFICASEKASIGSALLAFQQLEQKFGASLIEKLAGKNCRQKAVSV